MALRLLMGQLFDKAFRRFVNAFEARVVAREAPYLRLSVPELSTEILARDVAGVNSGQTVSLALRPEKLLITRERPEGPNVVAGHVKDLAYFGKDSLYRIRLETGTVLQVNNVNARRAAESERVAQWEDKIWLSFEPSSVILLRD
jgi:putrescine transport system ATP-binding protein